MIVRRDVFQAIADPTRREILNRLAHQSLNVNSVAENFDVSRTAVYKHLKMLTECGLVVITQQGRERYCEAKLDKLNVVSDWVGQYRKFWTEKLDSLETYLAELQAAQATELAPKVTAKKKPAAKKKRSTDKK
ncbi:MAG: metalloregulator ArsR/SmtB family transcription factor [Bacteroidota bacterium]